MDILVALAALLLLAPLLVFIAVAIRLTAGKPVIFRQWRTGSYGRQFLLLKFRTMESHGSNEPSLTRAGDFRVTSIGKWLRRWKLDELPQFWNVLGGDMGLVGPRPDVEEFWNQAPPSARQALALRPGITGAASVVFRDEESLLAEIEPDRMLNFYLDKVLPYKAQLDLEYASRATFFSDCGILLRTLFAASGMTSVQRFPKTFHEHLSR